MTMNGNDMSEVVNKLKEAKLKNGAGKTDCYYYENAYELWC